MIRRRSRWRYRSERDVGAPRDCGLRRVAASPSRPCCTADGSDGTWHDERMQVTPTVAGTRQRREWRIAVAVAVAVILWRSAIFAFWPQSYFDSDQAIFGLMAKHLA